MSLRFITLLSAFLCSLSSYAASGLKDVELRDLYFGEVLYYAYQDLHFDALARLDTELSQYYAIDESAQEITREYKRKNAGANTMAQAVPIHRLDLWKADNR